MFPKSVVGDVGFREKETREKSTKSTVYRQSSHVTLVFDFSGLSCVGRGPFLKGFYYKVSKPVETKILHLTEGVLFLLYTQSFELLFIPTVTVTLPYSSTSLHKGWCYTSTRVTEKGPGREI